MAKILISDDEQDIVELIVNDICNFLNVKIKRA